MTSSTHPLPEPRSSPRTSRWLWVFDVFLVFVLLLGAYFRVVGLFWGENQYLHPDERFLIWVGSDITPVKCLDEQYSANNCPEDQKAWMSLGEYFDSANSTLNPVNRGHGFYVYGTLPMFLARFVVEWVYGHSGFSEMTAVGRSLSALADLLSVLLVYLVAERLYDKRVGLLAAAFSAAAVLQIQQSHFFTMDTFTNFFIVLAFYFAVRVMTDPRDWKVSRKEWRGSEYEPGEQGIGDKDRLRDSMPLGFDATRSPQYATGSGLSASHFTAQVSRFTSHPLFLHSLGFGLALGMAVASKINAAPMAVALPTAMAFRILSLPRREWRARAVNAIGFLLLAAAVSLLVFRLLQPYAFSGPGFFGLTPNPQWLANMRELRAQSTGDVDFPPAMQWARRPVWFSAKNLVLWGLGLPLGLLAWGGFLWAGWQMLKGQWHRHALIWGWTALYFTWQSLALNPTMRYQLPIYPMLAIFAAWAVVALWDRVPGFKRREELSNNQPSYSRLHRLLAVLIGGSVLLATYTYAFAFTRIYTHPITRVEASRWIYQNIPGPINLRLDTAEGIYNQPLPFPYSYSITPGVPYQAPFKPNASGTLYEVFLPHVNDQIGDHSQKSLSLTISAQPNNEQPLATASLSADLTPNQEPRGEAQTFTLDTPVSLLEGQTYYLRLELQGEQYPVAVDGQISLHVETNQGEMVEQQLPDPVYVVEPNSPFTTGFTSGMEGALTEIFLANMTNPVESFSPVSFTLSIAAQGEAVETLKVELIPQAGQDGNNLLLVLEQPIALRSGENYTLSLGVRPQGGMISLSGDAIANEGEWDDGLPLRLDGYDGFGGVYPLDLNFNMYWDDTPDKLARFSRILDQSDYIVISSNRQWGSLPRLPERFPMTTLYYRNLLGCPPERVIEWCYNVAEPGMFQGDLGYELVETFQSDPAIGPVRINDQFAEEAFTVYDHPKVFVFLKSADYDPERVREILGSVDFSQVVRVLPMKAGSYPANLMLPSHRLVEQRQGGAWSALFDTQAWQNRFQVIGVLVWYLSLGLLGLIVYPFVRLAFPGLPDRGYPLARIAGLLIHSYLVWLAGSLRIPSTRLTITLALGLIAMLGGFLAFRQRRELRQEWQSRRSYFLVIEGLFLAFFVLDLLIRLGNPDLWHPFKGGEKPMDFAYFNAVLKSTTFPPYDPWFAGGYLNYYYYGFVFMGVLVKWLGIMPSIAFNLILPTIFALIALGAFSIAWNLFSHRRPATRDSGFEPGDQGLRTGDKGPANTDLELRIKDHNKLINDRDELIQPSTFNLRTFWVGLAAALGMAVLGNLGTVRMIFQGYQRLAAPGGVIEGAGLLTRWVWALRGFVQALTGTPLPYGLGDWYWIPSRAIPPQGDIEPITEFPFFTVLYADPHAHLFALPITLLALSFALAMVLGRARWQAMLGAAAAFLLGGLAIGALRPTNTWDFYPYLALSVVAIGYTLFAYIQSSQWVRRALPFLEEMPDIIRRLLAPAAGVILLVILANILYQPYLQWYGLGYGKVDFWKGSHTPVSAYLTHWGLFLFVIVSWMAWETRDWLASTPLSAVRKLEPYKGLIQAGLLLLFLAMLALLWLKVAIAWVVLPLAAWAGALLLKPGQSDAKRFVLFLTGTGLVLTLFVEIFVLRGDIGRMNTVFKFYLQVWTLFAVSAAAALGWLLLSVPGWLPRWRNAWQIALAALVVGAALYPLMAGLSKIRDRMVPDAPNTLDGMAYMAYANYDWQGEMDLSQDYRAIRWMQENVPGSPVIVEAAGAGIQYSWFARFSIYTGLPDVVGWQWHEQQQRAVVPGDPAAQRGIEVGEFYQTTDLGAAQSFLRKYDVRYIIVGQLERNHYPGPGLEKFSQANGSLWREVYRDGETVIYEVPDAQDLTAGRWPLSGQ